MTQLHSSPSFSLKANSRCLVFDQSLMQKLDRYRTVHRQVTRTIHRTHSAGAERFLNKILLIERPAYKRVRCRRCPLSVYHLLEVRSSGQCHQKAILCLFVAKKFSFVPFRGLSRRWWRSIAHAPPDRLLHSSPLRSQSANDFRTRRAQKMRTTDER